MKGRGLDRNITYARLSGLATFYDLVSCYGVRYHAEQFILNVVTYL